MRSTSIAVLFIVLLSVRGSVAAPRAPAPARRLPAPEHVSPQTRQEIRARMSLHGATMQNLVRAVVLLDRPTIRLLANRIADEEIVARAGKTPDVQRPPLPPRFFLEQDELAATARQLAAAAVDGGEDAALADRFAALTRTCVGCHSAYLHDQPDTQPQPADTGGGAGPPPSPGGR
jgi:cytochrome c553